jgi:dTMP kinase
MPETGRSGADRPDQETTLLPRVPQDEGDRTHEIPHVEPESGRSPRPRPDWAEETPLDDVPSLADELLGTGEDDEDGGRKRRRGK